MFKKDKASDSSIFLKAVKDNDRDKVNKFLQKDLELLNARDAQTRDSALHVAVAFGHKILVDQFIQQNQRLLAARNIRGETPLLRAIAFAQHEMITYLKEQYHIDLSDPQQKDNQQNTPLLVAAVYGQQATFDFLVTRLAIAPQTLHTLSNQDGSNALLIAASCGHLILFQHLQTTYEFSLHTTNKYGDNAWLLAGLHTTNKYGDNAWLLAGMYGHIKILEALLETNPDQLNTQDTKGNNVILLVAFNGQQKVIDYFQEKNLLVPLKAQKNNTGVNVLHMAVRGGQSRLINYLLDKKDFSINDTDDLGNTVLHQAVLGGIPNQLEALMNKFPNDLNIDALNKVGETSLMLAIIEGRTNTANC